MNQDVERKIIEMLFDSGIELNTNRRNMDRKTYAPKVQREGDTIKLPEGAYLPDVIAALKRKHEEEETKINIHVTHPVSPWDGALALVKALKEVFGLVIQKEGPGGAHQIDVEVELGKTIQVPWGKFEIPGLEGASVETDTSEQEGRIVFQCHVTCKKRYEERIRRFLDKVQEISSKESLHRGKAFSIAFNDDDGDRIVMPKPKFFNFVPEVPIFQTSLENAIERNVFVPIEFAEQLAETGASLKRGVLFAGNYGTGKTLLASHIAKFAISHGWTFIYVKNSEELPDALRYAQQYQPVVVFAEDVDRIAGEDRTDDVNELLNQLDGIDSKSSQIITILTSNYLDKINEAMLRPGRIDAIITVEAPDEETVERMLRTYGGDIIEKDTDLTQASLLLAGQTPARVRESLKRAKLEAMRRTQNIHAKANGEDLAAVAQEVLNEQDLFARNKKKDATVDLDQLGDAHIAFGKAVRKNSVMTNSNGNHH